ncbi:MAG: hypothetical protein LUE20_02440 [Oscillospiraceae bacterium]|nr:hypothetical protein [Oscillospiraceae bacterium]
MVPTVSRYFARLPSPFAIRNSLDDLGTILHLIEDDERLFRLDLLPTGKHFDIWYN